ncbi:hypothetical protein BT69DRAFT_1294897 [Atractiella rhizophila]|nr:hypothetical protein BT69DRAFT_1294897 [Atractiella rhizophila]
MLHLDAFDHTLGVDCLPLHCKEYHDTPHAELLNAITLAADYDRNSKPYPAYLKGASDGVSDGKLKERSGAEPEDVDVTRTTGNSGRVMAIIDFQRVESLSMVNAESDWARFEATDKKHGHLEQQLKHHQLFYNTQKVIESNQAEITKAELNIAQLEDEIKRLRECLLVISRHFVLQCCLNCLFSFLGKDLLRCFHSSSGSSDGMGGQSGTGEVRLRLNERSGSGSGSFWPTSPAVACDAGLAQQMQRVEMQS